MVYKKKYTCICRSVSPIKFCSYKLLCFNGTGRVLFVEMVVHQLTDKTTTVKNYEKIGMFCLSELIKKIISF